MPCLKTILNCFALEHSAFLFKTFESVLRLGIRLNFSSDNTALSPLKKIKGKIFPLEFH